MDLKSYIIKCDNNEKECLSTFINQNNGQVVYSSPVLPIIGAKITHELKAKIEENFCLVYIKEEPIGTLKEIKGSLSEVPRNPVTLIPSLSSSGLRYSNRIGWGTNVAVLDSGVNEIWVAEHHDYTGFGSTPVIDHGTKVANIIKQFAPGSKILSFKVTHNGEVLGMKLLSAIDEAVTKADIINISIGFSLNCSLHQLCPLCESVNHYTVVEGKLFVVAAGNQGKENTIECPGNAQESITVGSVRQDATQLAEYSSRGVPGIRKPNIITTGTIYYAQGPNQGIDNGTSYSTPIVTGVSAALFHGLGKNVSETKSYLYSTAKDLGLPAHHQGFGLLDLDKLLEAVKNDTSNSESKGQI